MITFKQWGGHGYSLFRALNRKVRIAVLAVAYLTVALPDETFAQTTGLDVNMEYDLDEIEVSAQRAPASYSQVARIVSVIEREQIEATPAGSIQDLLEYAIGVDIRQRGTYGIQADVSVRGGSFDQTLILLNGINLSDPQTGHHNLNLPVSLKNIKRIEILNGPSARVYGPNAFSGAINIVTDAGDANALGVDVAFGEHGLRDLNVSGNLKQGKMNSFLAVNRTASSGYLKNTDFETFNIFYHGKLHTSPGKLDFQIGHSSKAFGANSFYTPRYPNQFEETRTTFASVKMETGDKLHITPALYWRRHHDRFELFRDNPDSWYTGHNYHMTDVYGASLNSWFSSQLGKTAFGAEFRSENIWSNVLGEPMDEPLDVPGEKGKQFTRSHSRTTVSYFAEHTFYISRFTASAGAMANWISDLNFNWKVYPGIDMSYQLTDQLKAYASVNKSLRMPTYTDLYYSGPTNRGNPNLKPEKSTTAEGGLKFRNNWLTAQSLYYHRVGKDLIDWVRESEEYLWETRNLTKIISDGVELAAELNLNKLAGRRFFLRSFGVNYSYNTLDQGESNYLSNYVLDNLKHKLVLTLDQSVWKNIHASWKLRYQDRNGNYERFEDTQHVGTTAYKPFWLTDLKVYYRKDAASIYLTATNLFDRSYVDIGNLAQPGRWISIGFKYQLDFKQ
ncbi:TonB-dependent receptor plug domain-containing protein [Gaoshiqia sp. Z1-71]|uniref:TonB-dependent receptor plug domain-containing protein n=1 Tax=Gaoshiqia hydrogeniformans TaxID=3290090 RepID=UPI003BF84AB3